jgi:hypothetical protein
MSKEKLPMDGKLPFSIACLSLGALTALSVSFLPLSSSDMTAALGWSVFTILLGIGALTSWLADQVKRKKIDKE